MLSKACVMLGRQEEQPRGAREAHQGEWESMHTVSGRSP